MTESSAPKTSQQQIGDAGESCVCGYLQQRGWTIRARQWRCRWGELDIVAMRNRALAFVEVKTRSTSGWDRSGLLAVDARKQKKIILAARAYLTRNSQYEDFACQFDVALVRRSDRGLQWHVQDYLAHAFEVF
ncbi:MAG: YraN family protein [Cyanobacteria bacterium P01_F01_bin.33]